MYIHSKTHIHKADLLATILSENGLNFHGEFVHKGHTEASLGVGIGVPWLLVHLKGGLWYNAPEPAG